MGAVLCLAFHGMIGAVPKRLTPSECTRRSPGRGSNNRGRAQTLEALRVGRCLVGGGVGVCGWLVYEYLGREPRDDQVEARWLSGNHSAVNAGGDHT